MAEVVGSSPTSSTRLGAATDQGRNGRGGWLRMAHATAELPFVEVLVDTPPQECERRDPNGLYARARDGEIPGFTGVDVPYEPPQNPELRVPPGRKVEAEQAVAEIIGTLRTGPSR